MTEVAKAVLTLSKALKEDPDYWRSWRDNISVQFQDAYMKATDNGRIMNVDLRKVANVAADNFLQLLTHDRSDR